MKDWLTEKLILAEPVDRPSELSHAECKQIAKEAAKPIAKMKLGGDLLERAYSVEAPQQLAVLLADCLQALPKPAERHGMAPADIAARLRVGEEKVLGWINSRELKASNLNNGSTPRWLVTDDDLETFLKNRQPDPPGRSREFY